MKKIIIIIITFAIIGVGIYLIFFRNYSTPLPKEIASGPESQLSLNKEYLNTAYKFSLKTPEDFQVREMATIEGVHTILIENKNGEGIQILISPFDDIHLLTADMIRNDLPDFKITDAESVKIDNDYTGLAFKSDNKAFSGSSREIWFVFHGNLYQISTYERFSELLKTIFETWEFL